MHYDMMKGVASSLITDKIMSWSRLYSLFLNSVFKKKIYFSIDVHSLPLYPFIWLKQGLQFMSKSKPRYNTQHIGSYLDLTPVLT